MKFLVFNLVVGAALAYLIVSDGRRSGPEAIIPEGVIPQATIPQETIPGATAPGMRVGPGAVAPGSSGRPPLPEIPDGPVLEIKASVTPAEEAAARRAPSPVTTTPRVVAQEPEDSLNRYFSAPETAPRGAPPVSAAEWGRQLRDIARDMEDRFLTGMR
jgi:hypothetical protein